MKLNNFIQNMDHLPAVAWTHSLTTSFWSACMLTINVASWTAPEAIGRFGLHPQTDNRNPAACALSALSCPLKLPYFF